MSFTDSVARHHDDLAAAMRTHRGRVMTTAEIKDALAKEISDDQKLQWMFPSDHCSNHANKGACTCALTQGAIFEKVKRGKYRVL